MVDVSIVIVTYNNLNLLDECLSSLKKHINGSSYEVIIVDNNSILEQYNFYMDKYPEHTWVRNEENLGLAKAKNIGINLAKGSYYLNLDSDTVFLEDCITKCLEFIKKNNNNTFVSCKLLYKNLTKQTSIYKFMDFWNSFGENFFLYKLFPNSSLFNRYYQNNLELKQPEKTDVLMGAYIMAPMNVIKKLNGFDEDYFFYTEEEDLCYRAAKLGVDRYYLPYTSIIHIGGGSTESYSWFKFKYISLTKLSFYAKQYEGFNKYAIIIFHYIGLLLRSILYLMQGIVTFNKNKFKKSYLFLKQLFIFPKLN